MPLRSWRSTRRLILLVVALATFLVVATSPVAIWAKPEDPSAPVLEIVAPVVNIHTATGNLDGSVAATETDTGARIRLDSTVLFGKDSAVLRPKALDQIKAAADALEVTGKGRITVTGYTDDLGSAAHGLALSKRRARAVADALRQQLPREGYSYQVVGKGEADPAVPNTSEANRAKNRRVIVELKR